MNRVRGDRDWLCLGHMMCCCLSGVASAARPPALKIKPMHAHHRATHRILASAFVCMCV